MLTRKRAFGLVLVAAVTLCSTGYILPDADKPHRHDRSSDEVFADIETAVPGFGGLFRDQQGLLTVYLSGAEDTDAVREAISAELPEAKAKSSSIRFLRGDYSFSELRAWRAQARDVHAIPGVTMTDVDEASNRVKIGIETEDARGEVEQTLTRLGIPAAAVEIVLTGKFFQYATLQDFNRPVVGGIQITFDCNTTTCFVCTDGFTAVRNGVTGFVTNSHCTKKQGGNQDTGEFQPFPLAKIGKEIADPQYFKGGICPFGKKCRFSDSAFVKRRKNTPWSLGFIAHPMAIGSMTISAVTPTFRITSETTLPLAGDTVNKVGRTTGWTAGMISATCIDVDVSDTNFTLLCQDAVDATVGGGDSGSPIFSNPAGATEDVSLYGILWGGDEAGTLYIFSRLPNIESELTALTTCDPLIGC